MNTMTTAALLQHVNHYSSQLRKYSKYVKDWVGYSHNVFEVTIGILTYIISVF